MYLLEIWDRFLFVRYGDLKISLLVTDSVSRMCKSKGDWKWTIDFILSEHTRVKHKYSTLVTDDLEFPELRKRINDLLSKFENY